MEDGKKDEKKRGEKNVKIKEKLEKMKEINERGEKSRREKGR